MKSLIFTIIAIGIAEMSYCQNKFPLLSSGNYSGGTSGGDFTDISNAQLKLESTSSYVRIPHLSVHSTISAVYNFQTGKNVFWGEPSDEGNYYFRGRNLMVEHGYVGIGTNSPNYPLTVRNDDGLGDSFHAIASFSRLTSGSGNAGLNISYEATETSVKRTLMYFPGGLGATFQVYNQGALDVLHLDPNGAVGIGTITPDTNALLTVAGSIHSKEIKVLIDAGSGPDYVFEEDYELKTLHETKNYISAYKHLPEIPSAKEMESEGVDLGEMNMILLKKIEELTLHLIEQNERIEKLETERNSK